MEGWQYLLYDFLIACDVHSGRKSIVGRLRFIHIVIGMKDFLGIRQGTTLKYMSPVGYDFIHIHIGLGTTPGLPYDQWKLIVPLSFQDLIGDLIYQPGFPWIEHSQLTIGPGSRLF